MRRVDHSMIYCKIAGMLTSIALFGLEGWACRAVVVAPWGVAAAGVFQKLWFPQVNERFSIVVQVFQASLALPALLALAERLPGLPMLLAGMCGLCYAVGAVVFVTERPRLWPRVFSFHELFHLLVLIGAAAHLALLVGYVAPM